MRQKAPCNLTVAGQGASFLYFYWYSILLYLIFILLRVCRFLYIVSLVEILDVDCCPHWIIDIRYFYLFVEILFMKIVCLWSQSLKTWVYVEV